MDDTRFMYQKSEKYPDQVAVMASFLPTFACEQKWDKQTQMTDQLEEQDLPQELESEYQYIFIIDRSGSMGWNNRM